MGSPCRDRRGGRDAQSVPGAQGKDGILEKEALPLTTITEEIGLLGVTQRNMELYPGGKQRDQTGVFAFFFLAWIDWHWSTLFFPHHREGSSRSPALRACIYLSFPSLFLLLSFVGWFFSASCSLAVRLAWTLRSGSAFQEPFNFRMFAPKFFFVFF
jgi:hypothetical protein